MKTDNELVVRIRLLRAGVRPRDVARALGVSDQAVYDVITGRRMSKKILRLLKNPRLLKRGKGLRRAA